MSSLFFLIPLAMILVGLALAFFIAAIRRGQFDHLDRFEGRMPDDFS